MKVPNSPEPNEGMKKFPSKYEKPWCCWGHYSLKGVDPKKYLNRIFRRKLKIQLKKNYEET